jgi:hypothetical protein
MALYINIYIYVCKLVLFLLHNTLLFSNGTKNNQSVPSD